MFEENLWHTITVYKLCIIHKTNIIGNNIKNLGQSCQLNKRLMLKAIQNERVWNK